MDLKKFIIALLKAIAAMKQHEFKKGDVVLVRDFGGFWSIGVFVERTESYAKYRTTTNGVDVCGYRECLPYNEETRHLLGTTDNYEEGER